MVREAEAGSGDIAPRTAVAGGVVTVAGGDDDDFVEMAPYITRIFQGSSNFLHTLKAIRAEEKLKSKKL